MNNRHERSVSSDHKERVTVWTTHSELGEVLRALIIAGATFEWTQTDDNDESYEIVATLTE